MGKKRNGVNNKLKGPAKWQKGSREARKLQQSRRDAKLAKAAKKKEALRKMRVGKINTMGIGERNLMGKSHNITISQAKDNSKNLNAALILGSM